MQTFLPYPDFKQSAATLDRARLGKQRSEAKIILQTLLKETPGKGWPNHPATKMWAGSEYWLAVYGMNICQEWISRGYEDNTLPFFVDKVCDLLLNPLHTGEPEWLGVEKFHSSHRSNLLRKDRVWYSQFGWSEPPDIPYYWPLSKANK